MTDQLQDSGPYFQQVGIVGVGLMGGSLASALKSSGIAGRVIGCDRKAEHLRVAQGRGLIDGQCELVGLRECELVVLAAPVVANIELVTELAAIFQLGDAVRLIMDLGSTKCSIMEAATKLPADTAFIGGHPMAGSEQDGPEAARGELFQDRVFFLVPPEGAPNSAIIEIKGVVRSIGARPLVMGAAEHDRLMAAISHLPHLVACSLIGSLDIIQLDEGWQQLAGTGLLDTTRIAAGEPAVWADIFLDNREQLLAAVRAFREVLAEVEQMLREGREEELRVFLESTRSLRWGLEARDR